MAPTVPPARVRERGYAGPASAGLSSWWQAPIDDEDTPELRWPESMIIFDRMRRQDAQVGSVLRAVTHPIRRTTWRLDGTGCRDEVTNLVATDLGLPIAGTGENTPPAALRGRNRFSWAEHLRLALLMLPFGHMPFEQVYRIDDAGWARLRKLGPRMPRTISRFNVAQDGGLKSIEQYSAGIGTSAVTIPVNALVVYVHEREGGNWLGQSLLRSAYKNWLIKDRLLRVQAQTIDRNGMGIPVYTAATPQGGDGEAAEIDAGKEIAGGIRSGDNSGAGLPSGAKLELMGVSGTLPDAEKPIRYHDEQIARAVLAHFLNLGTQTGSWALGSTFADFFTLSLQAVAADVAETATHHIVEDMVDLNFGADEPAPKVVFDEIGSRRDATAEAIKVLVDAGALTTDDDLERFVRTSYGLPGRDPDSDPVPPAEQPSEPAGEPGSDDG